VGPAGGLTSRHRDKGDRQPGFLLGHPTEPGRESLANWRHLAGSCRCTNLRVPPGIRTPVRWDLRTGKGSSLPTDRDRALKRHPVVGDVGMSLGRKRRLRARDLNLRLTKAMPPASPGAPDRPQKARQALGPRPPELNPRFGFEPDLHPTPGGRPPHFPPLCWLLRLIARHGRDPRNEGSCR
jgi:hypothetical protein